MTVPSFITAELLVASLLLCLYLHRHQQRQFVQLLQAWLARLRGKQHRQLRPHSPHECPLCVTHGTQASPTKVVPANAWAEQKAAQGRKKRVSSAGYGCPNADCVYFKVTDETQHALVSNGWRGQRERIRQWRCQACGTGFSSRRPTGMYWLKTPSGRVGEVLTALGEGVDIAATSRIFGHHPSTVTRWQRRGAQQAARLHEHWLVKLRLSHLQLDELVVRVRTLPERIFVWTAMDSLTKLLLSVHVGSRKKDDAMRIVHDVKTRLQPDCLPVFTSDGLNLYFYAITAHFGQWVSVVGKRLPVWQVASTLLYGQLRKVHTHGKVKFSSTRMLLGTRDAFRTAMHGLGLTGTIQTAFVERLNLTLRESIATLSRRTWSIAHNLETLRWSLEWGRAYYHFVRPHHSLTVRNGAGRVLRRRTPAVAAGLTHKRWTVQALLCLPLAL